jgi:hypothetical protein
VGSVADSKVLEVPLVQANRLVEWGKVWFLNGLQIMVRIFFRKKEGSAKPSLWSLSYPFGRFLLVMFWLRYMRNQESMGRKKIIENKWVCGIQSMSKGLAICLCAGAPTRLKDRVSNVQAFARHFQAFQNPERERDGFLSLTAEFPAAEFQNAHIGK